MTLHKFLFVMLTLLGFSATANAQLHTGDIVLWVEQDRIITGGATGGSGYTPARVFTAAFAAQGVPNLTTNPGLNTVPNLFPASQTVGLTLRTAARRWENGHFCAIPVETLTLYRSAASITSPATDPLSGAGPSLAIEITASGNGFLHTHPTWGINAPFSDGVYLLELEAWSGSAAATSPVPSMPFWVVLNQNAPSAESDAAAAWLISRVADATPLCPTNHAACIADFNGVGGVSIDDLFLYLNAWFIGAPAADINNAGGVSIDDLFLFLNAWFTGCP